MQIVEQQPAGLLTFKGSLDVPLNDVIGVINVSGKIREADIQPNGTFSATKVADLNITIRMKKEVTRTTNIRGDVPKSVTQEKNRQRSKPAAQTDPLIGRRVIVNTARAGVTGTVSGTVTKVTSEWVVLRTGNPLGVGVPDLNKIPYVSRLFTNTGVVEQPGEEWIPRDAISSIRIERELAVPQRADSQRADD